MSPQQVLRLTAALAVVLTGCATLGSAAGAQGAQGVARQPDVYLASLEVAGSAVRVGTPRNITGRPGYDNQPTFAPDGASLFYTSTREDGQADIYRYDLAREATSRVTTTAPESEYSATVVPGGGAVSVIRVERDSTQRLWRFPLDGSAPAVILERVKPVGYHVWADEHTLALFVLGDPATLQLADTRTGRSDTLLANIGRSLHRIPGTAHVSFVSRAYAAIPWVMELDLATRGVRPLARLPEGVEDHAWLPDGRLIAGNGAKLFVCDPRTTAEWTLVADLAAAGLGGITRLAVSPRGDRLAIVAVPPPPNASR